MTNTLKNKRGLLTLTSCAWAVCNKETKESTKTNALKNIFGRYLIHMHAIGEIEKYKSQNCSNQLINQ